MPYIIRDEDGKILRASIRPLLNGEMLPHHHPEVIEFLTARQQNPKDVSRSLAELRATDGDMSRAIEDVIMVMLKKNIIKMTDLPRPVQDRMNLRAKLRVKIEEMYDKASRVKTDTSAVVINIPLPDIIDVPPPPLN